MFRVRLKELREKFGYSQASFAEAFGTKQSTVGNWESGAREPKFDTMQRLADFFGVSVDYLLGRDDTKVVEDHDPLDDIKFALFGDADIDDDVLEDVRKFARFIAAEKAKKKDEEKKG